MRSLLWALWALGAAPQVLAADTLSTSGFQICQSDAPIQVQKLDVSYTRSSKEVVFDVAGTNTKEQKVMATLTVTAYGRQVYSTSFDPCGTKVHVDELCPVPSGNFSAQGKMAVPDDIASQIPSIAFKVPDLDGQAKLVLSTEDNKENLACVNAVLSNGKSADVTGVAWVSAGIAAGALAFTGVSAMAAVGGHPGASSSSPGFGDVMGWFHSMATNGMLSVSYPPIYQSFTKNFAWSTGLISWNGLQDSIDNFRKATGGNLTDDSYTYLGTLKSNSNANASATKRSLDLISRSLNLIPRSDSSDGSSNSEIDNIKKIAEELMVPSANIFMTVLLIFAIVVAAVIVGILLFKVILEVWALYGKFPEKLTSFRNDYWGLMARTITNMILIVYTIWVMYCIYQLKNGDSWAAKLLAGVTLVVFTGVLAFFAWRIIHIARKYKKAEGDTSSLYENKETWRKYSLFYDNTKTDFWWLFVPLIVYMLAKGCIIAGAQGHGMAQTIAQLVCESLLLILLLWGRPYARKSTMGINMTIQIVRVLSVVCVLVFIDELGLSQTTKTVTGVVLIVIQSVLTAVLAILIAVNAMISLFRENIHKKRRREAEKANGLDDLTPLDARESLLIDHPQRKDYTEMSNFNFTGPYEPYHDHPADRPDSAGSHKGLVYADYGVAHSHNPSDDYRDDDRSRSPSLEGRRPTVPGYGMAY
ncbi:hypothetical protein N7468_010490 [Penicillium chermesinum]|uniref:ML-like domain-containing protein n=1 Tax=Penicillium chermesinum TaxID=63820 RepID=A0A9W9N7S2_9EURO|nr:uncharacterized protein N7468_010490 [Penicillium chermesinum]KAJ5214811.1 hypothetical protein N7468_010490 [Penicillium chermesinum]KAJ6140424.1 hypothetical protein N7470_010429 [Penicillium chermesinum]